DALLELSVLLPASRGGEEVLRILRVFPDPADIFHQDFHPPLPSLGDLFSPLDDVMHAAANLHHFLPFDEAPPRLSMHQPQLLLRANQFLPPAFHTLLSQMSAASVGESAGFHLHVTNDSIVIDGKLPGHHLVDEVGAGSTVSVKRYGHGLVIRASTESGDTRRLMQRFYRLGNDCDLNATHVVFDKASGKLTITVPREGGRVERALTGHHKKAVEAAATNAHQKNRVRVIFDDHGHAHVFVPESSGGVRGLDGDKLTLKDGEVVHLPVAVDRVLDERRAG
ncbi:hypothetical protein FOZ63_013246, partial [Perkinsus olseni]